MILITIQSQMAFYRKILVSMSSFCHDHFKLCIWEGMDMDNIFDYQSHIIINRKYCINNSSKRYVPRS